VASVRARGIVVEFPIYNSTHRSLKKMLISASTGGRIAHDSRHGVTVRGIDGITFEIRPGDRVGLVGHNGSGKTTLLRVLAGAYEPILGDIEIWGRVASLLDISMGMDPEATGYENIYIRGLMMGLTSSEIRARTDEIAEFTELGEYLNMPIRTYSTGMHVRLAFAVSTSVSADIVLMDEWLSVGDPEFQQKASDRLASLVERTPILVLASHSMELIKRVCTRVFRLDHGRIVEEFCP